ncbi:MAG: hypothetical protein AAB948_00660, partial [Patescibacteria group bacterium]
MKLKYITDKDPWMLAEDIPDIHFQFTQIWSSSFVNDLSRTAKKQYKKILVVYHGLNLVFYYGEKDSDDFAQHLLKLLKNNSSFGDKINYNIRKHSDGLKKFSSQINPEFLMGLSNKELVNFYTKLDSIHTELYTWGWLPNAVDMFHGNLTNYLKSLLRLKLDEDKVNTALVTLSTHPEKSILQKEHESFLNLVSLKQRKSKEFENALQKHLSRFFYLKHLWIGKEGVYDKAYYLTEIKKFLASGENAKVLLDKENKIFKKTLQEQKTLIKKLKLNKKQKQLFNSYAEFSVTKLYRRDAQIFWSYKMDYVFLELSKRFKISFLQARCMLPNEVYDGLIKNKLSGSLRNQLKQRTKYFVYYAEKGSDLIFYGKRAKVLENKISKLSRLDINELSGQTACLGKVQGKVKIVNSISDMKKMEKGDILISIATNPDVVPAMRTAGAIV